jgi:hypothetical protein
LLQKEAEIAALEERLQAQRRRSEAASTEAERQSCLLASWRHAQAELMRTLPPTDGASKHSAVPKQSMLRFEKGPMSPLAAFAAGPCKPKQNPLEIFREVYKRQPIDAAPRQLWDDSASAAPFGTALQHQKKHERNHLNPDVGSVDRFSL